jgi:hypothetical protein
MKRLILDHFRRWWWILALGAVFAFVQGLIIADNAKYAFEFFILLLALWTGANLLNFDLQRGVIRAVAVLPLTAGQIGRSWWLATVAIPAIMLAALLFLGAGTFCHFDPDKVFPADRLAMASLFTLLWLGSLFTTIFPTPGFYGNGWKRVRTNSLSGLSMMMLFGSMIFCQDMSKKTLKLAIFLGVGVLLTVVGWLRAERFVLGRASFRVAALQYKDPHGQHHAPGGFGGIPFLVSTTCIRIFLHIAAMVALMALLWQWHGPQHQGFESFAMLGSLMSCWLIIFYQLKPVLWQLRSLRTLPVSATSLAAVMIAITILPLIALGALVTGVAGLSLGTPAALTALKSYTFILAPASLCVFFAVWRGAGMQTSALLLVTLFGFYMVPLWLQVFFHYPEIPFKIPFNLTGPVVAICVLLAFLLTRRALLHSNHAYRVQATSFGNLPWGAGR